MMATAEIDVARPTDRKLLKKEYVKIEYPVIGKSYSHAEVWKMGENILNEVFGTTNIKFD